MNDFDRRWGELERSGRRMRRVVLVFQLFTLLMVLGGVSLGLYALMRPEIIGEFVGRVINGFEAIR